MTWVLLILICAAAYYWGYQQRQRAKDAGEIIDRKGGFYKEGSEFTLKSIPSDQFAEKLKSLPYREFGISMQGDTGELKFSAAFFDAQLVKMQSAEGTDVYRFSFTHWRSRNGVPKDSFNMNRLQTALEKMFLEIDPETKVRTQKLESRTRIF